MAKKKRKTVQLNEEPTQRLNGLATLAAVALVTASVVTFYDGDASYNALGLVGHLIGWLSLWAFGLSAYLLLPFFGWLGWRLVVEKPVDNLLRKSLTMATATVSACLLATVVADHYAASIDPWIGRHFYSKYAFSPENGQELRLFLGGVPAYWAYLDLPIYPFKQLLSDSGIIALCGTAFAISAISLLHLRLPTMPRMPSMPKVPRLGRFVKVRTPSPKTEFDDLIEIEPEQDLTERPVLSRKLVVMAEERPLKKIKARPARIESAPRGSFALPEPSLLTHPKRVDQGSLKKDLKRQAEVLEETLLSFNIEAKVGQINCGPTITSFEVHPSIGVKVQKIKSLEHDIALNMEARSIRIIAPIPGKAAVGIEVPNPRPQEVGFRDLLTTYQESDKKCQLPVLLGKQVNGDTVITDLAKMPHLIIAGATGAGKSVCINTIVMSLVMNLRPDQVKILMIDPKKVELTPYTHLPHMIAPVITEPQGACSALNWLVKEMEKRYEFLKSVGVRNIISFNERKRNLELEEALDIDIPERMCYMVGIIDELADLMMVAQNDIETPIARIAQMARAVGIHLILATQRPSREVLTGLIKANFPTRIAFKVSSRVNSQIVLDSSGAESLLGNGDMLFLPPGTASLMRTQGAFIRDEDLNRVIDHICKQSPPNYLIESFDMMAIDEAVEIQAEPRDQLYDQALMTVLEAGSASTSYLQRKFKIGYTRAASLMDELEENGVIASAEGAKPRKVLMGKGKGGDEV